MSDANGGAPLLVTGMPRTATSWVGKMLEASGALVYVNEPLNPQHPPGRSPGVLRADVTHAFQYISEHNERVWLPAFRDTVRLRFHPLAEVRRNHGPYDLLRAAQVHGRVRAGAAARAPGPARRPLCGATTTLAAAAGIICPAEQPYSAEHTRPELAVDSLSPRRKSPGGQWTSRVEPATWVAVASRGRTSPK